MADEGAIPRGIVDDKRRLTAGGPNNRSTLVGYATQDVFFGNRPMNMRSYYGRLAHVLSKIGNTLITHEQLLHGPSNAEMALTLAQFQGAI